MGTVVGREGSSNAQSGSWGSRVSGWMAAAASTTTGIGLVTYGFLRLDYALFYGRFGLKPEDIGLGQAELISQSLIGVLLMVVLLLGELVFLWICVWIIQSLVRRMSRDILESKRGYGWGRALIPVAGLGFILAVNIVAEEVFGLSFLVRLFVSFGAILLLLLGIQVVGFTRKPGASRWVAHKKPSANQASVAHEEVEGQPIHPPPPSNGANVDITESVRQTMDAAGGPPRSHWMLRTPVLAIMVVVTVALVQLILALSAVDDARRVRDGRIVQPTILGLPLVSWGAVPARIAWVSGTPPKGLADVSTHCLLYLGQASSAAVFYDHDTAQTVRIPTGVLVISITPYHPSAVACPPARG